MAVRFQVKDWLFQKIHGNHLVYNTCWEDPRCDLNLLQLQPDSEVVMITSAGCNALDYLLEEPKKIHTVDVNPRQNALLELKITAFKKASFEDVYSLFGKGIHRNIVALYQESLRPDLSPYAQRFWDRNLFYFDGLGLRKRFYHYGTSGTVAWLAHQYFKTHRKLGDQVEALLHAQSMEEQREIYYRIEEKILTPLTSWLVKQHLTMCLVGVPTAQQSLVQEKYQTDGIAGFIKDCLRKVFTELPLKDNYFWRLYLQGYYQPDCCPRYLQPRHFQQIRKSSTNVATHTTSISQFLKDQPGYYSHFVLLDHQDWLAEHDPKALAEEWSLILTNSRPGARILMRSAAENIDFVPDFVKDAVVFEKDETQRQHRLDRVGTYASVHLAIVK